MYARRAPFARLAILTALPLAFTACDNSSPTVSLSAPHVVGKSKEDIGKYLVEIAGCHTCHTPGVFPAGNLKNIPESAFFTGSDLGFNGPWGTTYASNLRLKLVPYNESIFIAAMRQRTDYLPMPWSALHAMSDDDLGSVLAYVKSLGPAGSPAPDRVPVGMPPKPPFIVMTPDTGSPLGTGQTPRQ